MDERKNLTDAPSDKGTPVKKMKDTRPLIEEVESAPRVTTNPYAAYNDFLIRVENLRRTHPDWGDPKNQHRPFKQSFLTFIQDLVARLPVSPEIIPTTEGTVKLRFKKHAPRDRWQVMEITVSPRRHVSVSVKSRLPNQEPFIKTDIARPDILSDLIQLFYEHDTVAIENHPIRYRKSTIADIPALSMMCQLTFGPHEKFSPTRINKILEYCVVADDPVYGIISAAGLTKTDESGDMTNFAYEVLFMITTEPFRQLGIGGKCLRKAITNCLIEHPDAKLSAKVPLADGEIRDDCKGALARCGFQRVKIVHGECRYKYFDCDRCNVDRGYCDFENPTSVCSTVYYELRNHGGKLGYGGRKPT